MVFFEIICAITERVSITKINPIKGSTSTVSVRNAITPMVAPRARDPVSPMKNSAGGTLNHRKAAVAPKITPHRVANMNNPCRYAIMPSEKNARQINPPASPSSPSVMFTALADPTITKMKRGMYHAPISMLFWRIVMESYPSLLWNHHAPMVLRMMRPMNLTMAGRPLALPIFFTFSMSSVRPRRAKVSSVASGSHVSLRLISEFEVIPSLTRSGDMMATSSIDSHISEPPIVGVPALSLCSE